MATAVVVQMFQVSAKELRAGHQVKLPGREGFHEVTHVEKHGDLHQVHFKGGHKHHYHSGAKASVRHPSAGPNSGKGASTGAKETVHVVYDAKGGFVAWTRDAAQAKAACPTGGVVKQYKVAPFGEELPRDAVPRTIKVPGAAAPKPAAKKTAKKRAAKKTAKKRAAKKTAKRTAAKPAAKKTAKKRAAKKTAKAPASKKAPASAKAKPASKKAPASAKSKPASKKAPASAKAKPASKKAPASAKSKPASKKAPASAKSKPASKKEPASKKAPASKKTAKRGKGAKGAKAETAPKSGARPSQRARVEEVPPTTRSGRESDESVLHRIKESLLAMKGVTAAAAEEHFKNLERIYRGGGRDEAMQWGRENGISDPAEAFNQWVEAFTDRAKAILQKAA